MSVAFDRMIDDFPQTTAALDVCDMRLKTVNSNKQHQNTCQPDEAASNQILHSVSRAQHAPMTGPLITGHSDSSNMAASIVLSQHGRPQ